MNQAPKESHVDNNYKHMPKICERFAKDMPGVILRLQIQDNYLKQRYAKDMPGVILRLQMQDNNIKQRYEKIMPNICQRKLPRAFIKLPKIWN